MAQEDYSLESYFGTDKVFTTDSPFLVSSSQLLNDPLARDHFVTSSFRRNHPELPTYVDNTRTVPISKAHFARNAKRIEELMIAERRRNPAFDAYFEERHYDDLRMEKLATYPHDSVGNILYRFCKSNNYAPVLGTADSYDNSNFGFFMTRVGQTHDLEHLLAGFGFDYFGEQGAVWIRHAAYFRYLDPELAGYLNTTYLFIMIPMLTRTMLHYPQTQQALWDIISDAMAIGRTSEPIYLMKYDPVLHLSIPEAREALGYRNTVDRDVRAEATVWAEGIAAALDPRLGEDIPRTEAA